MANSISGALGATGAGATVTYSGQASGTVTADGSGNYTIPSLANGDYTITPSKSNVAFTATGYISPIGSSITGAVVNGVDITGVNYSSVITPKIGTKVFSGTSGSPVTSFTTGAIAIGVSSQIICILRGQTGGTSISDSAGDSFGSPVASGTDASGLLYTVWLVTTAIGGGGVTFTVNFPSASFQVFGAFEAINNLSNIFQFLSVDSITKSSGTFIDSNTLSIAAPWAFVICNENATSGGQAAANGGRGLLTATMDQVGANFATNWGHGVITGATSATAGVGLAGTGTSIVLFTAVFGWVGSTNGLRGNVGVGNATVSYSGPRSGSVTADVDGNYIIPFTSVTDIASWTVTPSGATFTPSNRTVVVSSVGVDSTGNDFVADTTITSAVTYTFTDTTITAQWTTAGLGNSKIFAGVKSGLDNTINAGETSHVAVVTGLLPSTVYLCTVQSGTAVSSPQNITTAAAQARFMLSSSSNVSGIVSSSGGDACFTCVSNDGKQYMTRNDDGTSNCNLVFIDTLATLHLTNVNTFTGLGSHNTFDGQDSPLGAASTKKWGGNPFSIAGNLFLSLTRQSPNAEGFLQYRGGLLKSTNKGANWANWQAPTTTLTTGHEPSPVFAYQYGSKSFGWFSAIRYAIDDGTLGYNLAGNQIDGANAFIYFIILPQGFAPVNLARIPRRLVNNFTNMAFQYWIGPAPNLVTPADFVNDSNWSSIASGLTDVWPTQPGVDWPTITFVPRLNSYILTTFSSSSNFIFAASPIPVGPWTIIHSEVVSTYNGPCPLHSDIAASTSAQNLSIRMTFSSNLGTPPLMGSFTLTTSAYPISGNVGAGGAIVSYTGTASGSVVADALGYYTIPNLANGAYALSASHAGFTFSPLLSNQTVSNADITGVNFTATATGGGGTGLGTSYVGSPIRYCSRVDTEVGMG